MTGLESADVTVTLTRTRGQPVSYVLKPSVHAFRYLSRKHGGLNEVVRKVSAMDIDTLVDVIEAGANLPQTPKGRDDLSEQIFESGLTDDLARVPEICINYVLCLMRGGRPPLRLPNGSDAEVESPPPTAR